MLKNIFFNVLSRNEYFDFDSIVSRRLFLLKCSRIESYLSMVN